MVDYERVGSLDSFDIRGLLEKEDRVRGGFIARKGPLAVIVIVIVTVILGLAIVPAMSKSLNDANDDIDDDLTSSVLDLVPVVWILCLMAVLAITLLGIGYVRRRLDGYEGGPYI